MQRKRQIVFGVAVVVLLVLAGWVGLRLLRPSGERVQHRGLEAIRVPEGFVVEQVAAGELVSYPTFATFDERGRLFVTEANGPNSMTTEEMLKDPGHRVRVLTDTNGDGVFDESRTFADKLPLPRGLLWYRGSLYVAASPDLLRFDDPNGDGVADHREVLLSGWVLSVNGATLGGPFLGPDGWLYLTDARRGYKIQTKEGPVLEGKGPRIWRCRPDGTGLEWVSAGGFDNPVEVVFTPSGETIGTMTYYTDPKAGQRDALMHWVEGGVYPKPHSAVQEDKLKLTGELMPVMSKFPRVSPSGLERYRGSSFGPEYRDNLFSVQFNTHRVVRHVVSRSGATFQTRNENFLTSSDPDFHPTDVTEDADGSLLVLDTGGWFIKGCPVSRVAKPEYRGAIYRIRKKGAPPIHNPRGEDLKLETLSPAQLVRHLEDLRPAVKDRALDLLVRAGASSLEALAGVLKDAQSPETRCAAAFGLHRISSTQAQQAVRTALKDPDFQVRVAAARAVGLARDREAVERLMEMVQADEPPVRRQAATALGQIGDGRSAEALLAAAANPVDRFVEHAIIRSLIGFNEPAAVLKALKHPSPRVRKAALIVLDQMDDAPLRRQHVAAALADGDPDLRNTALWVVSHHPDWSGEVLQFLRARLTGPALSEEDAKQVGEVLVSFAEAAAVQSLVAEQLGSNATAPERKLFLLETMDRTLLPKLPDNWVEQIGRQAQSPNLELRSRAVSMIRSRSIHSLVSLLDPIANNSDEPAALRISALGALVSTRPELNDEQFRFLLAQLRPETAASERLLAAQVLGRAKLNDQQLLLVARKHLPEAGPVTRSTLLDAFQGNNNPEVGSALVSALLESSRGIDSFEQAPLQELFKSYPESVRSASAPLLARLQRVRQERTQRLHELEGRLPDGDPARGQKIFFGQKVACSSCHTIGAEGKEVGPDLTSVGAIRSRHDLLEAIIFPSASFVRGHEVSRVQTANDIYVGIAAEGAQVPGAVILKTGPGAWVRIPRSEILSMKPSTVSLMPEGLDEVLKREELADLIAFLESQK